jgi:endonuclease/exonuclease/phosphatase family metal-dependent hydrolase
MVVIDAEGESLRIASAFTAGAPARLADRRANPDWSTMRLVTLNTWKGDGAYRRRLIAMAEGLRSETPDIVLLQESLGAPEARLDTAAYLAETLGMDHVAWHGRRKRRMVEGQELDCTSGVAVLSRMPILASRIIALPSDPEDGERAALAARIGQVEYVSLHLTHLADGAALRRNQLETILRQIDIGPSLLGGDFNAEPASMLFDELQMADSRTLAGIAAVPTCEGRCIDHVMAVGWLPRIDDVRLVLTEAHDGVIPSDHAGLAADFGHPAP